MSENVAYDVWSAKIQISLCNCAVGSESALCTFWIVEAAKFVHADSED